MFAGISCPFVSVRERSDTPRSSRRKGSTVESVRGLWWIACDGGGFGSERVWRVLSAGRLETIWITARSRGVGLSLTAVEYPGPAGLPFPGMFSDVRVTPLESGNASTHRPATGPDGPSSAGKQPPEGTFESLARPANCCGRRPGRPAGRGPQRGSRTEPSHNHDRLQPRALVRPVRRLSTATSPLR